MRYRALGATGLHVSEIGFGTWGIGGTASSAVAYGPTDDAESRRALRRAVDLGVTFFDTADLYGGGHSERLIGETLGGVRDAIVIAGKAGFRDGGAAQDFSAAHLRNALEASLRRLGTDRIDLYQLHGPPLDAVPGALETLAALRRQGKLRALGVSVRSPDDGLAVSELPGLDAIQVNFSLVDQRAVANGLLARCVARGIAVIVRTPLCFGFLTGAYPPETAFAAGDHRRRWSPVQVARWAGAHETFAAVLRRSGADTPAQGALRFCLSYPAVASVIPGMLTVAQVEENAGAGGPLGAGDRGELERIAGLHEFYLG